MSTPNEGSAVVTTDQIYAELRHVTQTLLELKVRFEAIEGLQKRIEKIEDRMDEDQKNRWQLPVAWTAALAGAFGTTWQTFHK